MFIVVEHDEFCNMQIVGTSHSHEDARIIMRLAFNNELKNVQNISYTIKTRFR